MKVFFYYLFLILFLAGLSYAGWFYWKNLRGTGPIISPADKGEKILNKLEVEPGFSVSIFAEGLVNPRVMLLDSSGNLLASLTSDGKVVVLPDKNHDGKADEIKTVAEGLKRPH